DRHGARQPRAAQSVSCGDAQGLGAGAFPQLQRPYAPRRHALALCRARLPDLPGIVTAGRHRSVKSGFSDGSSLMRATTRRELLAGPAGKIECAVDEPEGAPRGVALVAHPHPLFGGTLDNKVVQTLARAFVDLGYSAWRPNFRGVGATE